MAADASLPRINPVDYYLERDEDFLDLLSVAFAADAERVSNTGQLALITWGRLCGDVDNGGFAQFFYNYGEVGVEEVIEMLDALAVPKIGDLLRQALAIYREHQPEFQVENPWEGFFGSIKAFDPLDREFLKSTRPANKALEAWTRAHIEQIAVGRGGESLSPSFTGTVEVRHPNGELARSLEVKKGKAHGTYREFFEDGSPRKASLYRSGSLSEDLWPTGQPKRRITKKDGQTVIEWFYAGGNLHKRLVQGKDGFPCEPIQLFHENGQIAEILHMEKDERRGPWLRFFPDGSPRLQAEFLEGKKLVVHNAWDDDGHQIVVDGSGVFYSDGKRIDSSGSVVSQSDRTWTQELKDGVPDGKRTMYNEGVLWSVDHYHPNGIKHGESLLYWNNGRVHHRTLWTNGEEVESESFPKYDRPVPAVIVDLRADERLYVGWKHLPVDEYPAPINKEEVFGGIEIPEFLKEVHERNLSGTLKSDYEDASKFDDRIAYYLTVDETGAVTDVWCNTIGVYSRGQEETYERLLRELRFTPARKGGNPVASRVMALVHHTFVEG
jgi:antitoxin component YwqK of YwqJK toxin-antitoxin module